MDKVVYNGPAPADAVLRFQQQRIITTLFTEYLLMLETLGNEHDIALDKLAKALPSDYAKFVDLADYLTPEKGQQLRKRVLDRGNDAWRNLHELVERSFNVQFK